MSPYGITRSQCVNRNTGLSLRFKTMIIFMSIKYFSCLFSWWLIWTNEPPVKCAPQSYIKQYYTRCNNPKATILVRFRTKKILGTSCTYITFLALIWELWAFGLSTLKKKGQWGIQSYRRGHFIAPGRCGSNFKSVISKQLLWIKFMSTFFFSNYCQVNATEHLWAVFYLNFSWHLTEYPFWGDPDK